MALIVMADDGIVFDGRTKEDAPLGGAETAYAELAEALAARGHEVVACSRCAAPLDWRGVGWRPLAAGVPESADLYVANRSSRLILACRRARRAAFWLHNPARYLLKPRYQWRLWYRRPAMVFLGPSHLATYPAWGQGGARLAIPYGISEAFRHAAPRLRAPAPRAVFLSNPQRGLDWLLDLWAARIAPKVAGAELHIFGGAAVYGARGESEAGRSQAVMARAAEMAGQGVVLRGPLDKPALAREFGEARLFLYRGDPGETFCNAAAETQAMGLPGVVQPIASLPERVQDGVTGVVAAGDHAFAAAAVRLLSDDALWLSMHRACLDRQRSRGWAEAASEWEGLLPATAPA